MRSKAQDPAEGSREIIDRELARSDAKARRRRAKNQTTSADDVRHCLGDLQASQVSQILGWRPTMADLEAAAMALSGDRDALPRNRRSLSSKAMAIFDIVARDDLESR